MPPKVIVSLKLLACASCPQQELNVLGDVCRHAMISRRIQGANPCAEHGRSAVKSQDPSSCLINDAGDLVDRATNIMHDSPYNDPAWENDPFWSESYPAASTTGGARFSLCSLKARKLC